MSKNSKMTVEKSKENILSLLKTKGNISDFSISRKLECSRQKVWRIRKELEESSVIWGYSIVLDQKKINRKDFVILLKRSEKLMNEQCAMSLIVKEFNDLIENKLIEIESIMCLYGVFDLMLSINSLDVLSVKSFISEIKSSYGDYFEKIIMLESLEVLKKNYIKNPKLLEKKDILLKLI